MCEMGGINWDKSRQIGLKSVPMRVSPGGLWCGGDSHYTSK